MINPLEALAEPRGALKLTGQVDAQNRARPFVCLLVPRSFPKFEKVKGNLFLYMLDSLSQPEDQTLLFAPLVFR